MSYNHILVQEISNILYGVVYFLAVPTTSMLLLIYALGNLHVTSWGTRESNKPSKRRKQQLDESNENSCSCFGLCRYVYIANGGFQVAEAYWLGRLLHDREVRVATPCHGKDVQHSKFSFAKCITFKYYNFNNSIKLRLIKHANVWMRLLIDFNETCFTVILSDLSH